MTVGVYILIKGFDVIYIGQSCNVENRLLNHKSKDYDQYVIIPSSRRKRLERDLIRLIKPVGNIHWNGPDYFITNLRMSFGLAERVKAAAETAKRSMNKEIELALKEWYA